MMSVAPSEACRQTSPHSQLTSRLRNTPQLTSGLLIRAVEDPTSRSRRKSRPPRRRPLARRRLVPRRPPPVRRLAPRSPPPSKLLTLASFPLRRRAVQRSTAEARRGKGRERAHFCARVPPRAAQGHGGAAARGSSCEEDCAIVQETAPRGQCKITALCSLVLSSTPLALSGFSQRDLLALSPLA